MNARDIPLTRAQIQEWVNEALENDEDPELAVRERLGSIEGLPPVVNIGGDQVNLVDHIVSDLPEYLPREEPYEGELAGALPDEQEEPADE